MNHLSVLFTAVLVVAPLPAAAIEFDTGKWQITMQSQNPQSGQPIVETTLECIRDRHFDPSAVMVEDNTCQITDKKADNNKVTWKMKCGGENMPPFQGEGTFISRGRSAEGILKVIMTMGDSTMEMQNKWHGRWVAASCEGM